MALLPPPLPLLPLPLLPLPPSTCSDISKIHSGIGDRLALLIQWVTVFVGGFVVGFIKDYRLTLVLIAFVPFLAVAAGLFSKVRVHLGAGCTYMYMYVGAGCMACVYMYVHVGGCPG